MGPTSQQSPQWSPEVYCFGAYRVWPKIPLPTLGAPEIQGQAGPKAGRGGFSSFLQEWPPTDSSSPTSDPLLSIPPPGGAFQPQSN